MIKFYHTHEHPALILPWQPLLIELQLPIPVDVPRPWPAGDVLALGANWPAAAFTLIRKPDDEAAASHEARQWRRIKCKLITALQRYCHHSDCSLFDDCPNNHPKCKPHLNLDTAIAWEAASLLWLSDTFPPPDHIRPLLRAVSRHAHYYDSLYTLLHITTKYFVAYETLVPTAERRPLWPTST